MLDDATIKKYLEAGRIAQTCLQDGAKLIVPGASMKEVLDKIEQQITSMGGGIAFPAQISLNTIAAHYCAGLEDTTIFKEGDIAKLDIGVHIDGFIADNAITVNLGSHDDLSKASKEALAAALKIIRPEITLGEIGKTIQDTIRSYGYEPVRNLSGHGLGQFKIHVPPSIPNFDSKDQTVLREDMVVAIEPFATSGKGLIHEAGIPTIFTLMQARPVRSPFARTALQSIQKHNGLPFASRWLEEEFGVARTRMALQELTRNGSLRTHPPLPEMTGGLVSQHEHSVIVRDKPIVFTKRI
jgi:methionyl aminopeptidase